jgi:DNA-binding NarL/FixJ family response regulator
MRLSTAESLEPSAAPVAVVDSVSICRRGLVAICDGASVQAVECASLKDLQGSEFCAALVVLRSEADWRAIANAGSERSTCPVVAVVSSLTPLMVERALRAGATGVIEMSAEPATVVDVLREAMQQKTVLPASVAQQIAEETLGTELVSPTELQWLRALDQGATIAELGHREGYSPRQMQRLLSRLYTRLDVKGRKEALRLAQRLGLLE